jgi:hypothetical protein
MLYMVTFTINIPPMLAYIPYMDPMGITSNQRSARDFNANILQFLQDTEKSLVTDEVL